MSRRPFNRTRFFVLSGLIAGFVAGRVIAFGPVQSAGPTTADLAGTSWQLVKFQGSDS